VRAVRPKEGYFVFEYVAKDGSKHAPQVVVPNDIPFEFNGKLRDPGESISVKDLQIEDRVTLKHDAKGTGRVARHLSVTRLISSTGTFRGIDADSNSLVADVGDDSVTLPLSKNCKVVINGREFAGDRKMVPTDLKRGDQIKFNHDNQVVRIEAVRVRDGVGVVQRVLPNQREIEIRLEGDPEATVFSLGENCNLTLGGGTVMLAEIQPSDEVEVTYDAADPTSPIAQSLSAIRASDRSLWALIIGIADYDDQTLTSVDHLSADAQLLHKTLVDRYRVPPDQAVLLKNVVRGEMKDRITDFLSRIKGKDQLLVYFAGHAYMNSQQVPLLAARNFDHFEVDKTGLPLRWLIDQIEDTPAASKLLALDTCHQGTGADLRQQPSSQELVMQLEKDRANPVLKTLTVLVSCRKDQRGFTNQQHGKFALALANAFAGHGDTDGDQRMSGSELQNFVSAALRESTKHQQESALVEPAEAIPPRLSQGARGYLRQMATAISDSQVDVAAIRDLAGRVESDSPGQPEPKMLLGLAQLKAKQYAKAIKAFNEIHRQFSDQLIPALKGIVWAQFQQEDYAGSVANLVLLVTRSPRE
ncbi:MAG: caspase family protein, partial [Planctomycetales bacterium]